MPEEYKMELPADVKVTITDLPNVCDPADDTICDSCA